MKSLLLFAATAAAALIDNVTDTLLFVDSLSTFESHRDALDPPTLDWTSDGCTDSPDDPFGFPFLFACHRHDFGYQNYRAQSRFTKDAKTKVDDNFKKEYVHSFTKRNANA